MENALAISQYIKDDAKNLQDIQKYFSSDTKAYSEGLTTIA